jgi:hypothetical protein
MGARGSTCVRDSARRQPVQNHHEKSNSRHIQEAESDRRSIKEGWYATNKTGQVCSSRFSNREDCQAHIEQEATRYCGHAVGDNGYRRRAEEMWRSAIG